MGIGSEKSQQNGQPKRRSMMTGNNDPDFKTDEETSWKISNIASDAFSLATIGVALAGFLVALVSSVFAAIKGGYPNFSWWSLFYMMVCIIAVIVVRGMNSIPKYHSSLIGFLSAGLVLSTSSVNALIYVKSGAHEAAAAGFILMSMVSIVWIFYWGEYSIRAERRQVAAWLAYLNTQHKSLEEEVRAHMNMMNNGPRSAGLMPQSIRNNDLATMEQSTPQAENFHDAPNHMYTANNNVGNQHTSRYPDSVAMHAENNRAASSHYPQPVYQDNRQSSQSNYPYKAKAIYSYQANPDDANEISFEKHEILEVSDVSGRWWQAKRPNGQTGIAPSNYLILL